MDWTSIILAIVGSGAISSTLTYIFGKRRENVDIYETYLKTVNERINKLERRQYLFELRDTIQSSAVSCAHKCDKPDEDCPVLQFLSRNPLPDIRDDAF